MYQQLIIVGNVGKDCEMNYTPQGIAVAKFSVAVNKVTGKGEDRKEKTTWFRVTVWRERAETASQWIKKGMRIMVIGEVAASAYTGKEGDPIASLEVTAYDFKFLSKPDNNSAPRRSDEQAAEPESDFPADIPF